MIHLIVGNEAARNLEAAFELDANLQGEIVVLRDTLGIGDIEIPEEMNHDDVRTAFWKEITSHDEPVTDEQNVLATIEKAATEEEPVCFWLSPCVSDVCAYYWLLTHFKPKPGMLHTINIIGLPFLNEKGSLFYPINFSQVPPKEFIKTKRLLKEVTVSEYELETDEWKRLQDDKNWVRIYEGGKKIVSKDAGYFDTLIKNSITTEFQKATRIVHEAQKKITQTLSHFYIEYRLKKFIEAGGYVLNGAVEGPWKDLEIKKGGGEEGVSDQ